MVNTQANSGVITLYFNHIDFPANMILKAPFTDDLGNVVNCDVQVLSWSRPYANQYALLPMMEVEAQFVKLIPE